MANRVLRDWTDSERVDSLTPNAEVFFVRLIMKADDFGSFHGNPKLIKSSLFPLKDAVRDSDISRWITECEKAGLILVYEAADKKYVRIIDFGQRLRNMRNKFPDPDSADNSPPSAATRRETPPESEENQNPKLESETEGKRGLTPLNKHTTEEFERFEKWIQENAPQVGKLGSPFTLEEFEKLKKEHPGEAVREILLQMHNKRDLTKKYTSAYLTCLNWLKRAKESKIDGVKKESRITTAIQTNIEVKEYLKSKFDDEE